MRRLLLATVAALVAGGAVISAQAAAPGTAGNMRTALEELNIVEDAQYRYRGRRYCWYPRGWRGPGWYRCGYWNRRGIGWGGPAGWNNWRYR